MTTQVHDCQYLMDGNKSPVLLVTLLIVMAMMLSRFQCWLSRAGRPNVYEHARTEDATYLQIMWCQRLAFTQVSCSVKQGYALTKPYYDNPRCRGWGQDLGQVRQTLQMPKIGQRKIGKSVGYRIHPRRQGWHQLLQNYPSAAIWKVISLDGHSTFIKLPRVGSVLMHLQPSMNKRSAFYSVSEG